MSFILLKKKHTLIYQCKRKDKLSLDRILDNISHFLVTLLYNINYYKIFSNNKHRTFEYYESCLKEEGKPRGKYTKVNEVITDIKVSFTLSIPIEYLNSVCENLRWLLHNRPFYTEHGRLAENKNQIRDTFKKLQNLRNFETTHDSFLCTFDFSKEKNLDNIDGLSIEFLKLFESTIILNFTIQTNKTFMRAFNLICLSKEWKSSVAVWNDWRSIIKGYTPILHLSEQERIRELSYNELILDARSTSEDLIINRLFKGINSDFVTLGNESLIYKAENDKEIDIDSSIFNSIHSRPRQKIEIKNFNYFEKGFDAYNIFILPKEDSDQGSLTWLYVSSAIYDLSFTQYYYSLFYLIRKNQHKLNHVLFKLFEKKWYHLFLYKNVARIKAKLIFLKNLYIRMISDDDPTVLTMDSDKKSFNYFVQKRKEDAIREINNRLNSINDIIEDANNLTVSYLSTALQYFALVLAFFALFNLSELMPMAKIIGTYIGVIGTYVGELLNTITL